MRRLPNKRKQNLIFKGCHADYDLSQAVVFSVPDRSKGRWPGTPQAGRVMREKSHGMETFSPYQNRDLTEFSIFDGGDLVWSPGSPAMVLDHIEAYVTNIIKDDKLPVMISEGNLVTLGAFRAAFRRFPYLHLLQLDAHANAYDVDKGEKLSGATVTRRCWDLTGDGRIIQMGIRSGEREEFDWMNDHTRCFRFDLKKVNTVVRDLANWPVYLTLNLDVLDPSIFPGTAFPEAGGISFQDLIEALFQISSLQIVAFDLNGLFPSLDPSGMATATALTILRELLTAILKQLF